MGSIYNHKLYIDYWKHAVFFALLICFTNSKAQDLNFSQYHYTPFQVNPALVGVDDEGAAIITDRISAANSGQKINTFMASVMYPLINKKRKFGGVGLNAFTSKEGEMGLFKHSGISTALSQSVRLNKRNRLSLGLQAGFLQNQISPDGLTTSNQWISNVGFDPNQSTGENFNKLFKPYVTLSAGLYWHLKDDVGDDKVYLGVAGFNLNQPQQSFFMADKFSSIRYTIQGGMWIYKSSTWIVQPEFMFVNLMNTSFLSIGSQLSYYIKPSSLFSNGEYVSLQIRYGTNNTVTSAIQFNKAFFVIGLGYDKTLLTNSAFNIDTYELLLAFKKRTSKKRRID